MKSKEQAALKALKEIVKLVNAGWIASDWPEAKADPRASAEQVLLKRIGNVAKEALD